MRRILTVLGTRPEAIKLAPLLELLGTSREVESRLCVTAQHRGLTDGVLALHGITPDHDLDVMTAAQELAPLTARLVERLDAVLTGNAPDLVVVQGDTTTCFTAALAAFYRRIPVAHVEAGLRSGRPDSPFPEEINRRLTSSLAELHFAPTTQARDALLAEGRTGVHLVGNPIVDAVRAAARRLDAGAETHLPPDLAALLAGGGRRVVTVTCHRRESFGAGLLAIVSALAELADTTPDVEFVFPVHPNPSVRGPVHEALGGRSNLHLTAPLPYPAFLSVLRASELALTDSGGVQEECASLGIPLLVMREVTERPEVLASGLGRLVGSDRERILQSARELLATPAARARMAAAPNPFGDGHASLRIAHLLGATDLPQAPAWAGLPDA